MLFNRITILAMCLIIAFTATSQKSKDVDYKFGNVTTGDFDVSKSKIVDNDAAGVILYEAGETHFVGNDKGWFSYVFTCTEKILIVNKKAFDLATVRIGLYSKESNAEVLSNVKANTYNLNNGTVSSTSLDKKDIFSEKEDQNHAITKFTLPGVQEGSIIEYTYTITSPYVFNIPSWTFQRNEYPVLWSEYNASVPSTLMYVSVQQGFDSFYIKKVSEGYRSYRVTQPADKGILGAPDRDLTVGTVTNNFRWVKKDVKPLKIENYVSSPRNYIDRIEFQLSGTYNGESKSEVVNTWQAACKDFLEEDDFQKAMSGENGWIKDAIDYKDAQSDLDIAKRIYYDIQDNYACIDTENVFKRADLYDVYKKQKGSVRGINLLLIAMLKNKNIYAQPAMLSTRENGFLNPHYPVINKLNYLVCRATIGGKTYLLDASNPSLGFGQVPAKCYNGYVQVIDAVHPDSLYLLSDSLKETRTSSFFLSNDSNGNIKGYYKCVLGQVRSTGLRERMRITNTEDYFKDLKKQYSFETNLSNAAMKPLEQKEIPVSIQYDISFKPEGDIIYFNPVVGNDAYSDNPFKAETRSYPIEMPYCIDETYVFNMEVPVGYKVDELPKPTRVILNDNEGMFEYLIQQSGEHIQLRCRTKLNKTTFEPEAYETLRNFFGMVVNKENEQIVFKKL